MKREQKRRGQKKGKESVIKGNEVNQKEWKKGKGS